MHAISDFSVLTFFLVASTFREFSIIHDGDDVEGEINFSAMKWQKKSCQ